VPEIQALAAMLIFSTSAPEHPIPACTCADSCTFFSALYAVQLFAGFRSRTGEKFVAERFEFFGSEADFIHEFFREQRRKRMEEG
jgi:hypothetical protein